MGMSKRTYSDAARSRWRAGPAFLVRPAPGSSCSQEPCAGPDYPNVQIVGGNWLEMARNLREEPGIAFWMFGGGALFGSLCEEGLVDSVEVALMPILLGGGIPLVSGLSERIELKLKGQRTYEKTITVNLVHGVKSLLNE